MPPSDPPSPPAIAFRKVSKRFGSTASLIDVDFAVPQGAFFGVVGVNGAGKTTLLKCLLDTTRPDGGTIEIFGTHATRHAARANLAYLPERFGVPHYATGRDYLALMTRLYQVHFATERVDALLSAFALDPEALSKPVRAFSKGMTQKLGLIACLLSGRRLLVLDEPASGLDPLARAHLKTALADYHRSGGTVLLTSHALPDVEEMCTHMALLHEGTLCFEGPPAGLCDAEGGVTLEEAFLRRISG
jgi:ABC-2 type transport system ATP-binding protein